MITYGETTFDDISNYGDNSDRVNDIMAVPSVGQSSIVRYGVPQNKKAKIHNLSLSCNYEKLLLSGAYIAAQNGAVVQVRLNATVKLEQKFNWTGLSGYIGGADDYGDESGIMLSLYDMHLTAGDVLDIRITGTTNIRRMIYGVMYGTLDDGTKIRIPIKEAVDGTTAVNIAVYTVPAGRTLDIHSIGMTTRHIDLYAGKGYMVCNGIPVMAFDVFQTDIGGVYGLSFPFWDLPMAEGVSIGFRLDSFACGNEVISGTVYATQEDVSGSGPVAAPLYIMGIG